MIDVIDYNTHEGKIPDTCAVINMPNEAYRAHPAYSKSDLDLINRSMAHFVYAPPREPTRAMEVGAAIHTALLEPFRFIADYVHLPNCKDRRASEYKEAIKHHGSERVLVGYESDKVKGMKDSAYLNPEFDDLMQELGWCEISFFCIHEHTGESLKCRFDRLTYTGVAMDVKKTQDVRYDKFQRSVANYRYHVQEAFYTYIYERVTGEPLRDFCFFCIEEETPNANKFYRLDDEAKQVGLRAWQDDLKSALDYKECSAELPKGLVQESELMSLPAWALDEEAQAEYQL